MTRRPPGPRRAEGGPGWDDGDRNGEPSEESDPTGTWALILGGLLIGALVVLVLAMIILVATTFPTERTYSDEPFPTPPACDYGEDLAVAG